MTMCLKLFPKPKSRKELFFRLSRKKVGIMHTALLF